MYNFLVVSESTYVSVFFCTNELTGAGECETASHSNRTSGGSFPGLILASSSAPDFITVDILASPNTF